MTSSVFAGDVVVITGAGRGLGRAYAEHLCELGARVVVNDIDPDVATEVAGLLGAGRAIPCVADVATAAGAARLVTTALDAFGRVDAVVCNAGSSWHRSFAEVTDADLADVLGPHLYGTFHVIQAAWPHFVAQRYGRIVTTASGALFGYAGRAHYAAAKGAVVGLTNTIAVEGREHGIAANTVLPHGATRLATPGSTAPPAADAAPPVAWLCHRDCTETGQIFGTGGGRMVRHTQERHRVVVPAPFVLR